MTTKYDFIENNYRTNIAYWFELKMAFNVLEKVRFHLKYIGQSCNFRTVLPLKLNAQFIECGTDEAGRGCLAGPVTAAAVILPDDFTHPFLTDSKQLSKKRRTQLQPIIEQEALCYSISHVMMEEIDQINILNASIIGMHRAIDQLTTTPEFIAIDGNKFKPYKDIAYQCVIKGDAKFMHIAAASILAKTYRDAYMEKIHREYPMYKWDKNKGYPTQEHRAAIREFGPSPYHRKSFRLLPEQYSLFD